MKKILFLLFAFTIQFAQAQKNTIIIIADDLGTDYLGYYPNVGDTAPTPSIRSLLSQGVQFNNAWANPVCSPTRAALFTGRYGFRTGVGDVIANSSTPQLDTAERSVARLLRDFSPVPYETANVGKWHLHLPTPIVQRTFPNYMGYDLYSGNFNGAITDYFNWNRIKNGVLDTVTNYATTQTVDDAINWLDTLSTSNPFFLWVAFNAPHSPFHLPPANLHSYTNLSGTQAHINANPKEYFKAMVEAMDTEIGRLFQYLDAHNLRDSTNIIFIGDNGEERSIAQIVDSTHAKGSVYEPGVRVPMIISGPSVVNPGRQSDALVSTLDLFATILDLSGFSNWINFIPAAKLPVDSKSLYPIIRNDTTDVRDWIFTEQFDVITKPSDAKAMKTKSHKLMKFDSGNTRFYDLTTDSLEQNNLFNQSLTSIQLQQYNYLCNELNALLNQSTCTVLQSIPDGNDNPKNLIIYPNPFSDLVNIHWLNHENNLLDLRDMLGRSIKVVYSGVWDLSCLKSGLYFLYSSNDQSEKVVKLLKVD
ncbi:MAG: sulfatase-like hydrolase/transferase [Bacteroidetes bacterium]|nr:sulfatase-like hydrolase/transferase [Bacteroidota bacterium]